MASIAPNVHILHVPAHIPNPHSTTHALPLRLRAQMAPPATYCPLNRARYDGVLARGALEQATTRALPSSSGLRPIAMTMKM